MFQRHPVLGAVLVALMAVSVLVGCSDDDAETTGPSGNNHTFVLTNGGTNTTECVARQFTRIELVRTNDPSKTVEKSFVSNPNTTIDIELTIPETGTYKVTFYVAQIDSCIWWDSIALEAGGTTTAILSTNNTGFFDNSYVAGIRSSGNNIPCTQ